MPHLDAMLAGWPVLYPEIASAGEQDNDRLAEADRIREQTVTPILESRDLAASFTEHREAYKVRWR